MVATRRGVRVCSPSKTEPDQFSDTQATPSTVRRTRSAAKQLDSTTQHGLVETSSHHDKTEGKTRTSPPPSTVRRCTRASRLHSPEQPCTPVGSVHEADMSDLESCCSAASDIEPLVTRVKGRSRQSRTASGENEDISEVESCSSAVSASKTVRSSRRSTRKKTVPESSGETEDVKVDQVVETESCSPVESKYRRVTRSQRKTASTRLATKQTEDSEASDADSCMSSISGADVFKSITSRATRSIRKTLPIPFHLDETSESSQSPAATGRRTRLPRGKPPASSDASEPQSGDSEGFESGPIYSMATRRRGKSQSTGPKITDSESDLTDLHSPVGSPCSIQGRGTPCSSRTGSGTSSRGVSTTKRSVKDLSMVVEKEPTDRQSDSPFNDSRSEITVIAEDADCTLLGEENSQASNQVIDLNRSDLTSSEEDAERAKKGVNVISEEDSQVSVSLPDGAEAAVSEPAMMVKDQQEELLTENKDRDTSEIEMIPEIIPSSELLKPCQSVTLTTCDSSHTSKKTDEAVEVGDVDTFSSKSDKVVDEDAAVKKQPEVEKMEVSTLSKDDQQVVDSREVYVEAIELTSSHQHKIIVDSDSEKQPTDVIVQNTEAISLLESSDDDDTFDEENESEGSEEEDEACREEERGETSKKSESAAASIEGLFMIDTRPGQDADELYYKERATQEEEARRKEAEQEAQDEEFVDEEGDDEDDEDAEILFASRNPQLKELSSRIDPGISVKELGGLYINFDGSKSKPASSSQLKLKEKKIQDEVMKKSVIGPEFEKKDAVPPYSESKQALKVKRRVERAKSTGDGWFNMKAPEVSQELKGDLQVLKMRGSMDPKRFYKKNDRDGFPKYFQVGTVVDSAVDFYHSRIPQKERKRTMVEELLADAEFRHKNKKKYQQIAMDKAAQAAGKRNKKKNKFHK